MTHRRPKQQALYNAAYDLFRQYGWIAVSVERICRQAKVSRVTFYHYYPHKQALLQEIFTDHKNRIRTDFENLLTQAPTMADIATALFRMQHESLAGLYSPAILHDMQHHQDQALAVFFDTMNEEKYRFMRYFFNTLQQRRLIRETLPAILIDLFIQQMDQLMQHPALAAHYADTPQQLPQDILDVLLHGLSWRNNDAEIPEHNNKPS